MAGSGGKKGQANQQKTYLEETKTRRREGGTAVVEVGRGANLEKEEDEHDTSGQHETHGEV